MLTGINAAAQLTSNINAEVDGQNRTLDGLVRRSRHTRACMAGDQNGACAH